MLAGEFFPEFSTEDLVSLPQYHIYLHLMIDGVVSRGFSASSIPQHMRGAVQPNGSSGGQ
jgi:hypothetical protein